jgi:hypothetical protein
LEVLGIGLKAAVRFPEISLQGLSVWLGPALIVEHSAAEESQRNDS